MHTRGASQWQTRRKTSIGHIRRAHPASGATWNVQVVRGKMTSRCLWHACRALALGMVLMLLGAGMATIGYYADHLSIGQEVRGNATIRVKNESRGFHLNNLSYVGPIIMGFGGFIVVAACVMTFEARDSAAKVVPARFKVSGGRTNARGSSTSRRTNGSVTAAGSSGGSQTNRWDHHLGLFRTSPGEPHPDRQALTAALIHFSKALGSPRNSPKSMPKTHRLSRSGSVPNLAAGHRTSIGISSSKMKSSNHHHSSSRNNSLTQRTTRESSERFLHPGMLQYHRHALSVDESSPYGRQGIDSSPGSQLSVSFDTHNCYEMTRLVDRTKRSDTARKHVLSRQRPIEKDDPHSPRFGYHGGRRRSSTTSDASGSSRRGGRRTSSASRTLSIDSRSARGHGSSAELHSPEKNTTVSPRNSQHVTAQLSTPSVEREFRSQLSICSEPTAVVRALSCQSSIEPCVPEESPEFEDKDIFIANTTVDSTLSPQTESMRLESLVFDANINTKPVKQKYLYRSNSSKSFKKPKKKIKSGNEFHQIYFISSTKDDEYDSIEVIDERRNNNFHGVNVTHRQQQHIETILYRESSLSEKAEDNDKLNDDETDVKRNEDETICDEKLSGHQDKQETTIAAEVETESRINDHDPN